MFLKFPPSVFKLKLFLVFKLLKDTLVFKAERIIDLELICSLIANALSKILSSPGNISFKALG